MKHNKSARTVYQTSNYSLFVPNPLQRKFDHGRVDELVADMKKNGYRSTGVISVSVTKGGKLQNNTGHHRVEAAKLLGIPVLYVIEHEWTPEELVAEGVTVRSWNPKDVISAFAKDGIAPYVELLKYEDAGVPATMAASLLIGESAASSNCRDAINSGAFKIKTRKSIDILCRFIKEFSKRAPAIKSRSFISVFSKCLFLKEFDHGVLFDKLAHYCAMLDKTSNEDQMLDLIEKIYNFKSQSKIPLAFLVKQNCQDRKNTFGKATK